MILPHTNTATPNHTLQRTGSAVTAPAADPRRLSTHRQVPRPLRLSLSLGSFEDKMKGVFVAIPLMFCIALVLGTCVFWGFFMVLGLISDGLSKQIDVKKTFGFVVFIGFVGAALFFIPGAITATIASLKLRLTRNFEKIPFPVFSAAISGLVFYTFFLIAHLIKPSRAPLDDSAVFALSMFEILIVGSAVFSFGVSGFIVERVTRRWA